ncbi:MAG: hypothetical protein ACUVQ1_04815 [Candidatus Kapaibacteriales bacterium]
MVLVQSYLITRLEPNGILILVMTRWHIDDIVGQIKNTFDVMEFTKINLSSFQSEPSAKKWYLLRLPAIAVDNDLFGRNPDEPLWTTKFPIDLLMERKQVLSNFWFSALYQQAPKQLFGKIFRRERFNYFSFLNNMIEIYKKTDARIEVSYIDSSALSIFATIDLAITTNQQSDYTVAIIFVYRASERFLFLK